MLTESAETPHANLNFRDVSNVCLSTHGYDHIWEIDTHNLLGSTFHPIQNSDGCSAKHNKSKKRADT